MTTVSRSREQIVAAARRLFADRGYAAVTVRDIASGAQVSPALVIKLCGSKAELYAEAGPASVPLIDLDLPRESIGRALVRRILQRRHDGQPEIWVGVSQMIRQAPDPAATRRKYLDSRLAGMAELIGDSTTDHRHAAAVICHLIGLAEGLRTLELFPAGSTGEQQLVDTFAAPIQQHVDACDGPLA